MIIKLEPVNENNEYVAKLICSDSRFKNFRMSNNILYIGRIIENSNITKANQDFKIDLLLELSKIADEKGKNYSSQISSITFLRVSAELWSASAS